MATTANPLPGAVEANAVADPFASSPTHVQPTPVRYAAFDSDQFSFYASNSPASARRALEAHLKDTDRRIQDASKLGSTLVQQRRDLAARLKEVEQVQNDNEVPSELQKKLADLEREYNEVGRESARAFLPKSRVVSDNVTDAPNVLSAQSRESPSKMTAPSRKQRNQPSNRVHDIEFATEISTSLLAQVRQLQAALAEKDTILKTVNAANAQLEADATGMAQRIKHMDESEQRYKDENWNLETRLQELESSLKDHSDKHTRVAQTLLLAQSEKAAKERELDDLKAMHERLNDDHTMSKKVQEADLQTLRRDAATYDTERQSLNKKIDELTAQNTELAKAVSQRWKQAAVESDTDFVSADDGQNSDDMSPEHSEPVSPIKGTPARHGMLESETLKSSLNHAHRMIQNLKNNIHREKTEKIELKRMLQDARDELESRRDTGVSANVARKRKNEPEGVRYKKSATRLGANRNPTTEVLPNEPDWEDQDGEPTPSKPRAAPVVAAAAAGAAVDHAAHRANETESTDAFETANEQDTTESDAFATGAEEFDHVSDGDVTETEGGVQRSNTVRAVPSLSTLPADRRSLQSTASTSGDEENEALRTPSQNQQPRFRLRAGRASKRGGRVNDLRAESPSNRSPASSMGTPVQVLGGKSLGDELDGLDDDSMGGTPASARVVDDETVHGTPEPNREISAEPETPSSAVHAAGVQSAPKRPAMVDAGIMTDPWEPRPEPIATRNDLDTPEKQTFRDRAGDIVGGALAGFGLSRMVSRKRSSRGKEIERDDQAAAGAIPDQPMPATPDNLVNGADEDATSSKRRTMVPVGGGEGAIEALREKDEVSQTAVAEHPSRPPLKLGFSSIVTQQVEPVESEDLPKTPILPRRSSRRLDGLYTAEEVQNEIEDRKLRSREGYQNGSIAEPKVLLGPTGSENISTPANVDGNLTKVTRPGSKGRAPLADLSPNVERAETSPDPQGILPVTKPLQIKKAMADEGSQTVVSGQEIDAMLRNKNAAPVRDVGVSPMKAAGVGAGVAAAAGVSAYATGARPSLDGSETGTLRNSRRPVSAGSVRGKQPASPPPLPADHSQKIAAAQQGPNTPAAGAMGPPSMPASAYKALRPRTPTERPERLSSRDGTTPRPVRPRDSRTLINNDRMSSRTSVSSFASELDDRFNINRGQIMYPNDIEPATDPRMIQAITQTMIGEFLWKYTRKAGRSETSKTRHRRFFWVHPYTRTLYWSEQDPSTAGKNMLKAKSVAIESVRVITDDNTNPPGLHRKSLVVVTPGREIVFTAPTGQRHETWFNALSYLLLRTSKDKEEAEDTFNQEDVEEFNPGVGQSVRRSLSRVTGRSRRSRSRASLSSYNSRTTRNSSQHRADTLARRQSAAAQLARNSDIPTLVASTGSQARESGTATSRLSTIAGRFRSGSLHRGRSSVVPDDPAEIYNASVAADSAEDLRAVMERQDQEADRLENVRACCDGKHDVGSLSRRGRHSSLGSRLSTHGHSHTHSRPKMEPRTESREAAARA